MRSTVRPTMVRLFSFTLLLPLGAAVFASQAARPAPALHESKLVDLTHPFDRNTVYWPTAQPFEWKKESWGMSPGGYWYTAARYAASEHGGTHLDSPIHFARDRATVDAIPLSRLVGPAFVIDVTAAAARNPDYLLSPQDLAAFEKKHGRIPAGAIVLVRTGWAKFWPDRRRYLGTDKPGDTLNLRFPGLSRAAAEVLVERKVDAVGIDTASLDFGRSQDFLAHRVLGEADIYGLENVANLDKLPPTGATVIALPMLIRGGTGAPARIIAVLP